MKVIKNINNNVSLCLDSQNHEVVAFGKGIGFTKPPYEIPLSKIERTYYNINPVYISMVNDIPEEIFELSARIIDYARLKLENPISSNIVFTLADHIHFAIQRFEKNMNLQLPIVQDIQHLFEIEMDIGMYALDLLKKEYRKYLPKEEAAYIALHIINAESMSENKKNQKIEKDHIRVITDIIETYFNIKIDFEGFNYSRFVTHMHYLIKRGKRHEMIQSENRILYESLKNSCKETYECSQLVEKYLEDVLGCQLSEEECIYLMLHINRLCAREDCYL